MVRPLGQPPLPISLWMVRRPNPLIEAASILGRFASQSVQNRILGKLMRRIGVRIKEKRNVMAGKQQKTQKEN